MHPTYPVINVAVKPSVPLSGLVVIKHMVRQRIKAFVRHISHSYIISIHLNPDQEPQARQSPRSVLYAVLQLKDVEVPASKASIRLSTLEYVPRTHVAKAPRKKTRFQTLRYHLFAKNPRTQRFMPLSCRKALPVATSKPSPCSGLMASFWTCSPSKRTSRTV